MNFKPWFYSWVTAALPTEGTDDASGETKGRHGYRQWSRGSFSQDSFGTHTEQEKNLG